MFVATAIFVALAFIGKATGSISDFAFLICMEIGIALCAIMKMIEGKHDD